MAKLIKGDNVQNIITDGDVVVTSPSKIGKTLDEVLVEQQSDIDRLKSNVKYIYAYGGVGGSGSGGSGSTDKPISVLITLNGVAVNNGGSAIILDGKGKYKLYVKISNAGGKNLFMGYTTNGSAVTDDKIFYTLNGDNKYKRELDIDLNGNGVLNIALSDDEGNNIGYYTQEYIVDSDLFNVTLNYVDIEGNHQQYASEPYECFVSDLNKKDRYFKINYSIFLSEYTDVNIECKIDGVGTIYTGNENVEIPLDSILINKESILQNKYMGTYTLTATLSYKTTGKEVVRKRSFLFSIVPSGLYINVRTVGDVLYDSLDLLKNDIDNGGGTPYKCISQGSSLMMYCKVFEGAIGTNNSYTYDVIFNTFNLDGVDNNGNIVWDKIDVEEKETLFEQIESTKGVSVTFPTGGIKKIEIRTKGNKEDVNIEKTFVKYVYVKPFESKCDWFNSVRYTVIMDSYFRANQGDDSYKYFPSLSSGNGVLSLLSSSNPIELEQYNWSTNTDNIVCSIISLGIQVSNINSENAKILDIYTSSSGSKPEYTLRTTRLFTDVSSEINKIAIPTEVLNKNDNSQYHLVQIIRNYAGLSDGMPVFEDSLYIDGMLESVNRETSKSSLLVKKLILSNINICYNLINIQYASPTHIANEESIKFNPDGYAYQYWLSYKEKYVNSGSDGNRLTEEEKFIKDNIYRIFFDGTNVVIDDETVVVDIARISDLPTVVFSYNCEKGSEKKVSEFMELMWRGRSNGDTSFKSRTIDLHWVPARSKTGSKVSDYAVNIPNNFTDNMQGLNVTGEWEIDLQGTSTMRNRIKNYSLRVRSRNENAKILFSPNFDAENNKTFLPDMEWTIKADIADSAHANNTSIGKFVNDVCTKIETNIADATEDAKKFIKNTLEGIPVLLYFMCKGKADDGVTDITKIYYFGVYNFNLGRQSYYNLGYTGGIVDAQEGRSDFMRVYNNITKEVSGKYYSDGIFTFAVGDGVLSPHIAVGEIQDNYPEFDFHQYNDALLFKEKENNNACMFGANDKITAKDVTEAKAALGKLVRSVAKAGKFCFQRVGRGNDFETSREFTIDANGDRIYGENCINRYDEYKIPDTTYQKIYVANEDEFGSNIRWIDDTECVNVNENDLKKLITTYTLEDGNPNKPILNFTSASEYYTICMAFGMVDSVLKNMNLKNFRSMTEGPEFFCAFYDMDCALEEANDGEEKISYLAATDYWYSTVDEKTNKVSKILKKNDYWDSVNGGKGFDFTSSYLFAVVKYAKSIFEAYESDEDKHKENLLHYPQNFWAMLRNPDGMLRSADYFIDNYFKSGISTTFEYLASLNYRVKYLYHGNIFGSDGKEIDKYLANAAAFNGSRKIKVKNWLTKRLRFIDLMMNVNNLTVNIGNGLELPGPGDEYKDTLSSNNDITILHSAFDSSEQNTALSNFTGEVAIYAPKHTPFIFRTGSSAADMYLLPGGVDKPNLLSFSTTESIGTRFYGSGMFTSVDKIETMFTGYRSIISDNIEKITYGGSPVSANNGEFKINAKSVTEINLNIPKMGGKLSIDSNCISLMKLNISDSEFYGVFNGFSNLQEVNISGVNSSEIYVSGSDFLRGEKFTISGKDENHKTSLNVLDISGVTGNFNCVNTNIGEIRITNSTNRDDSDFDRNMLSEFSISGDNRLESLKLVGFRKVSITSCNNLSSLSIDDALEELYINLEKIDMDDTESKLKSIFLGEKKIEVDKDGNEYNVFDFTNYTNLKKVTLINCDQLEWVKLPGNTGNKNDNPFIIETDGMRDNPKLKWIDTGILPAFLDTDNKTSTNEPSGDGFIEGVGDYAGKYFPLYSTSTKLILCSDNAFYNCPNYAMLRSDWNKGEVMIGVNSTAYTNIAVSPQCTSLANTFSVSRGLDDDEFNMKTAMRFIEKYVSDEIKPNITSLSGCFRGRKNVIYTTTEAAKEKGLSDYKKNHLHPILEQYTSLEDISGMYENTGVTFVSKNLLDLPFINNNPDKILRWDYFVKNMTNMNIESNALYNISYRLRSYSYITFNIFEYGKDKKYIAVGENKDNMFNICDFFHPFSEEDGKGTKTYTDENGYVFGDDLLPYNNITSFESLNFGGGGRHIDFRGMFELFPNVQSISSFLNGNLSKYNLYGLLKPCKNIVSIVQSFCDSDIYNTSNTQVIDLFEFFNWNENTTDVLHLFEGLDPLANGFTIKKTISYNNLNTILDKITTYGKLTNLTNLFSYCTITGYNNEEIKFNNPLSNITNISNLFEKCNSDYKPFEGKSSEDNRGLYDGGVLNIGRSFFEQLPNFTVAQRTFANTYLSSSLTYDFFCKRSKTLVEKDVLLSKNDDDVAKLYEYEYRSDIINLKECFYNVKFVNCKNWFDENDNVSFERNYIKLNPDDTTGINERGFIYYTYNDNSGSYDEHTLDNDIFDDCLDNYTNYVKSNIISNKNGGAEHVWYNHDIKQDFTYYGNIKKGVKPFDTEVDTIQQTYCCLPPDLLYGCNSTSIIEGLFSNTNIIGVIPRNLTKKVKNQSIANIFRNVNIMPNLEYYYDSIGGLNASILDKITETFDIEDGSDSDSDLISGDYTVVFRDEYGKLKKRKPVKSDRNLGQFVYVPANFTTSGSLMNAFNFRYNLPSHWEMPEKFSKEDGTIITAYKSTNDFNNAIRSRELDTNKLSYHSQYYFLMDNCVKTDVRGKWSGVYNAKSVFISDDQDIDFSNKNTLGSKRNYYDGNSLIGLDFKNTWTVDESVSTPNGWILFNIEDFNIDLNLCGKKNEYNMIEDYGCPIDISRSVHLDNFISGILTIFLNGRIFDHEFAVDRLTTSNHKTSSNSTIIGYYGLGKNMILPQFSGSPLDDKLSFIPIGNEYIYYDFMVDNDVQSKYNYHKWLAEGKLPNGKNLFITEYDKYTFK